MEISESKDKQYIKMTETPIPNLVISLGIPTTISMLVTNIYNMADTFFVGHLGTSASGAIGIVFGFMAILQAFGFMFGQGAGSIISRKLGKKETEVASAYATIGLFLAFITGVIIVAISMIYINPLLILLGSTKTILPYAKSYVFYIMLAAPLVMSSFVLNNILRFEGKALLAMIGLVTGALLNIICDPIFIYVLDMGIAGAGIATALSQSVSFLILLSMFLREKTQSKLSYKYLRFDVKKIWDIVSTGFPSMVRQGLSSISTMVLNHCASMYGDVAVAAMSIVSRINFFIFAIGLGVGQGYQPVCGFNYGARKFARVRKAFKFTLILAEIMLGIMVIIGLILSPVLIGCFRDDPNVIEIGTVALRYQCIALLFQPLIVMSNMTFQSTGKRALASFTATLRSGIYFIPLIFILNCTLKILGIEIAQAIADMLSFLTVLPLTFKFFRDMPKEN